MLIHPQIKAVVFDHDDTLVGTIEPKWAQHKHVARTHYNKELTDDELRKHWGKPFSVMIGLIYGTDDIEQARLHNRASHQDFPKTLREDTVEVLERLKAAGKELAVVTATTRHSLMYDMENLGIPSHLFSHTQTEDDTSFHKPDPRVFEPTLKWLESINIQPAEVVYVGDGLHDMAAALGVGFEFIGVATGLVTQHEFTAVGARSVERLGDLITLDRL